MRRQNPNYHPRRTTVVVDSSFAVLHYVLPRGCEPSDLAQFALERSLDYDSCLQTTLPNEPASPLTCDGCGQPASPEHFASRLQRLEWTTRYRPIHIATLLLGAISPRADSDFLYAGKFAGEAGRFLDAVGISTAGKSGEAVLSEFQRGGFLLIYMLDCPLETGGAHAAVRDELLVRRIAPLRARIRRSLKPKRVVLISELLAPLADRFSSSELECPVILHAGKPFALDLSDASDAVQRFRAALNIASGAAS